MATPKKKKSGSKRKLKINSKIGVRKKSAVKKQATQTQILYCNIHYAMLLFQIYQTMVLL